LLIWRIGMTRTWHSAAQLLFGVAALALLTWLCYRLQLSLATTAFAYLILVVLLSLTGSFIPLILSILAVGFLNYFFAPPLFDLHVERPMEVVAFFVTSLVVIGLVRRGRRLATATLGSQESLEAALREAQRAEGMMREQAGLLDLTHDTVFVRDMNDAITYWNRGAEELYGWASTEAVGKVTHQLLQTTFPEPLEKIMDTLLHTGRWEGELVHTKRDGSRVVVASRWALRRDEQGRPVAILETNNDVTDRRRAEEDLRQQANLLEQTHDAILVWRLPGPIICWNRGAERLYGFSRAEAIGRSSHDLLRTEHSMPPERFETMIERDGEWMGELTHRTRDGRRVVVDSRHVLMREADGGKLVLETNRDITDRKRAEYLTEHVFESTPDAVTILGRDYRFQRVNPVATRRNGLTVEKMVGMHVRDVVGMDLFGRVKPYLDRCFDGEEVIFTGWFTGPLGPRHLVATFSPLRPQSERVEAALLISRDMTDQALAAEALREAQAQLAHVTRVTTLGEVTASLAHEVNQPLAAIVNNANACLGLLPHGRNLDEVRAALADIVSDGDRAGAIIERVRALARRSSPEKMPLRLADVVDDVVALTAAESATRRVAILTDVGPDLPMVLGDRVQLQQVLLNLVVNGMDAMSAVAEGKRRLEIRGRSDRRDGTPAALLSVQDHGIGLEAGQVDSVFEAFYTTKPQGMGMGLAISRSIIEGHGGRLWAENNQGPGVTFSFRIPAAAPAAS
jgi:PAS domain S-box-containing protein